MRIKATGLNIAILVCSALLFSQGCATSMLLHQASETTVTSSQFGAVEAAFLTDDNQLVLCVSSFSGATRDRIAVEISLDDLQRRPPTSPRTWVVPDSAVRQTCPQPQTGWQTLAVVERTTLPGDLAVSPRMLDQLPLEPGSAGTVFELPARNTVAYVSRGRLVDGSHAAAFQVEGTRVESAIPPGQALLLLPVALAIDAFTLPLQVLLLVGI